MTARRLRSISTATLKAWLRALERCPQFLPLVPDLRIACRNELWARSHVEETARAWLVDAPEGMQ